MQLRDLIRSYRKSHGLSQRQFAVQCDLSNGYISILEKGINPNTGKPVTPTIPQLKKLADGMAITLTDLLEQVDDMPIELSPPEVSPSISLSISQLDFTDEEISLIEKFRCLDVRGQAAVLNVLNYEYDSLPGEKANPAPKEA